MEVDTNDEEEARRGFESSLPENWVLCSSKTHTGRFYYFNSVTGESRWEHPLIPDMDSSVSICHYTISEIPRAFRLVAIYDQLENRRINDVIVNFSTSLSYKTCCRV